MARKTPIELALEGAKKHGLIVCQNHNHEPDIDLEAQEVRVIQYQLSDHNGHGHSWVMGVFHTKRKAENIGRLMTKNRSTRRQGQYYGVEETRTYMNLEEVKAFIKAQIESN